MRDLALTLTIEADDEADLALILRDIARQVKGKSRPRTGEVANCAGEAYWRIEERGGPGIKPQSIYPANHEEWLARLTGR